MIEFLFLDLDDTILDFQKSEKLALSKTLRSLGVTPTDEVCDLYSRINLSYWKRLERKELTRDQVLVGRFEALFRQLAVVTDAAAAADCYAENLGIGHYFIPGAEETVQALHGRYKLYLASNGTASVQSGRLKSADIGKYFDDIFISQNMGADKPDIRFFQEAFRRIGNFDPARAMIVGDSLTSDILGGIHAGIRTCWFNFRGREADPAICPDHVITDIRELIPLLESL